MSGGISNVTNWFADGNECIKKMAMIQPTLEQDLRQKTNLLLNNSLIFEHKAGVKKSDVWSRQLA
jgi:hypothetical protein